MLSWDEPGVGVVRVSAGGLSDAELIAFVDALLAVPAQAWLDQVRDVGVTVEDTPVPMSPSTPSTTPACG